MTGCKSGKKRFASLVEAQQMMADIKRRPREKVPKRIYVCSWCHGWHLTSKELPKEEPRSVFLKHYNKFKKYLN